MQYEIKKINGIDVIFANMPYTNSVNVEILVKAGSIYETREKNGISHFLEHMFFKGGKKFTTPQRVAEVVDEIGGESNAFTAEEYAGYYVKCAPEYIKIALEVLSDMLVYPQFPKDEIEKEKGVVVQEVMMYEDMPASLVMEKWKNFYYGDNSYGWSVLGPVANINSFTQEDLFSHKTNLYTKDNIVISIAGNIQDQKSAEDMINDFFKDLPSQRNTLDPVFPEGQKPSENTAFYDKGTEQTHFVIGADGYSSKDERRYAASILGIILGGNMSSRLYQEIREKRGLCYYIGASHYSNYDDGNFMIRGGIDKEKFESGIEAVYTEIQKIAQGDIKEDEFRKSISYLKGKTQMGIETSDQMSSFLAEQYLFKKEIRSLDQILENYEKVNIEEIRNVAISLMKDKLFMFYIK